MSLRIANLVGVMAVALSGLAAAAQTTTEARPFYELGLQGMGPASGMPDSLVIFLHGYGSTGSDFTMMSAELSQDLPDTIFLFPNAPNMLRPGSYSWYDLGESGAAPSKTAAAEFIEAQIDTVMASYDILPSRIVLAGFSQGGGTAATLASCGDYDVPLVIAMAGVVDYVCAPDEAGLPELVFVTNSNDPRVTLERTNGYIETAKSQGYAPELRIFDGASHWPVPSALEDVRQLIVDQLTGARNE